MEDGEEDADGGEDSAGEDSAAEEDHTEELGGRGTGQPFAPVST